MSWLSGSRAGTCPLQVSPSNMAPGTVGRYHSGLKAPGGKTQLSGAGSAHGGPLELLKRKPSSPEQEIATGKRRGRASAGLTRPCSLRRGTGAAQRALPGSGQRPRREKEFWLGVNSGAGHRPSMSFWRGIAQIGLKTCRKRCSGGMPGRAAPGGSVQTRWLVPPTVPGR